MWNVKELVQAEPIPVAIWDPDIPGQRATKYSALSCPLRVTLDPGDMLYLPSTWYHKVTQTCGPEGCVVHVFDIRIWLISYRYLCCCKLLVGISRLFVCAY